jgi:NAD(P)-dependent dehydrogenase (short-subunit alcohol dehydrogenase family)
LAVFVKDQNAQPLSGASVSVSRIIKTTSDCGIVVFEVLNNQTYYVSASKSGYMSMTRSVDVTTTGASTVLTLNQVTRGVITTPTVQPTGPDGKPITTAAPVPTDDLRSDPQKDQAMMDQIRAAGPMLIMLFIFAIVCSLLGFKL